MTFLLYAFSVPIVGLLMVFIGLVVGLSVGQKRNEIAVLRSRGATSLQIIGISILEGVLLGVVSVAIGLVIGRWLALLIGRSRSFLDFSLPGQLRAGVTPATVRFGAAAIVLATKIAMPTTTWICANKASSAPTVRPRVLAL